LVYEGSISLSYTCGQQSLSGCFVDLFMAVATKSFGSWALGPVIASVIFFGRAWLELAESAHRLRQSPPNSPRTTRAGQQ
jgi:hypothetical protein